MHQGMVQHNTFNICGVARGEARPEVGVQRTL
jgi:hypothetical protein